MKKGRDRLYSVWNFLFKIKSLILNSNTAHLTFITSIYIFFLSPVLKSTTLFPDHDNLGYHLQNYLYFSNSLQHGFGFPRWYPSDGGSPIGITSVSVFPMVPYRVLSYFLYTLLPLNPLTMYYINLILGMLIIGIGWWFFLFKLTSSRNSATFGSLMVLLGGSGITVLHQEQILATMTWIPWILLSLFQIKRQFNYIIVFAILFGFSMTLHYPQILLITILTIILMLFIAGKVKWFFHEMTLRRGLLLLLALILFIFAASPTLYIKKTVNNFSSPIRATRNIEEISAEDYIRINTSIYSSAPINYFRNYLSPDFNPDGKYRFTSTFSFKDKEFIYRYKIISDDQLAFYVSVTGVFFAVLAIIFNFRNALPIIGVLAVSAWASLGVYFYLPQLLFTIKFPLIGYFRHWYHFAPMVNFSLSALGAIGLLFINNLSRSLMMRVYVSQRFINLMSGLLIILVFTALLIETKDYSSRYIERFVAHELSPLPRFSKKEFLESVREDSLKSMLKDSLLSPPLIAYKEWWRLSEECPEVLNKIKMPFITHAVYNDINASFSGNGGVLKTFCNSNLPLYSVIANMLISKARDLEASFLSLSKPPVNDDIRYFNMKKIYIFQKNDYTVTPVGANLKGDVQTPALVVFPFSYKLGLKAYANGKETETYPVYQGGMTGIIVPKGKFDIGLVVPLSWYHFTLLIQAILLLFALVFSIYNYRGGKTNE